METFAIEKTKENIIFNRHLGFAEEELQRATKNRIDLIKKWDNMTKNGNQDDPQNQAKQQFAER